MLRYKYENLLKVAGRASSALFWAGWHANIRFTALLKARDATGIVRAGLVFRARRAHHDYLRQIQKLTVRS